MDNKEPEVSEEKNWAAYINEMALCAKENNPNLLEDLLMEDHPVLPGEKEAFNWLITKIDPKKLAIELDETEYHVVRKKVKVESK